MATKKKKKNQAKKTLRNLILFFSEVSSMILKKLLNK